MTKLHTWSTTAGGRYACSACGAGYWGADRPVYCDGPAWGPWIEHDGGGCPYPEADGQVRFRNGRVPTLRPYHSLGGWYWGHDDRGSNIAHYRLRADHPHYQSGMVTSVLTLAGYAAGTWRAGVLVVGLDRAAEIAELRAAQDDVAGKIADWIDAFDASTDEPVFPDSLAQAIRDGDWKTA